MKPVTAHNIDSAPQLITEIRQLISSSRQQLASTVNSALTLLYWQIGQRIHQEVLQGERAGYDEQIVATVAAQLEADYGRGFSVKNLRHMLRFAETFPEAEIVSALQRQLAWGHFLELIYLKQRDFCSQMCAQIKALPQKMQEAVKNARTRLAQRVEEG